MRARPAQCVAVAMLTALVAQAPRPRPEVRVSATAWRPPPPTILARTRLVELPVVVRSADGHAVAGLSRGRFQVFDNGKRQPLTFFSEVDRRARRVGGSASRRPPAAPATGSTGGRPRYIALFFDDVSTSAASLGEARNAAEQYLRSGIGGRDRFAVFTASSTVSLGFTRNLAAIEGAIGSLRTHPRASRNGFANCPEITAYEAYQIVHYHNPMALAAVQAEASVCHGGVGGFEVHEIKALADASWNLDRGNAYDLLKAVDDVVAFLGRQPGQRILIFTSGGFISGELNMLKGDMVHRALRAKVTIDALDARGLFTQDPGRPLNDASDYAGPLPLITWEFEQTSRLAQELANEDAMRQLSQGTGGTFFHDSNDLALGFRRLSGEPRARYELGFEPVGIKHDGKFHRVRVRLRPPLRGAAISTRRGYFAPPAVPSPARLEWMMDTAMAGSDMLAAVPASLAVTQKGLQVIVSLRFNAARLAFVTRQGRREQQLVILAGLYRNGSHFTAGERGVLDLALEPATWKRYRRQGFGADLPLSAPPGRYKLRVVVLESSTGGLAAFTRMIAVR